MPPRKKEPEVREPKIIRVRVEPYFAVRVVEDTSGASHAHELFLGATAREALNRAKHRLVRKDSEDRLLVVNGKAVPAISWANPIYPSDDQLIDEIMRITGGTLLD